VEEIINFKGFEDIMQILEQLQTNFPWEFFANKGQRLVRTFLKSYTNQSGDIENKDTTMMNLKN